ncbi:hypothetical protein [Rhizobium terrae]|uniref:hypothetical protein n=1 Tax=Rhizobium terrae TaxID=2171756 RepID=UPI000E3BCD6C|nr:hypothetical protein [Rhizobium terrae]
MNEWDAYRIRIPKPGERESGVSTLEEIYHVVHPPEARRILELGKISAGIVYDESRLNVTRTHVAWLSANRWGPGSIYGTVEFTFPWLPLIAGRRFYWVEAITTYNPPAYRILATDKDVSNLTFLKPYDPSVDKGPLRERNGSWYWDHEDTSEFLIDRDLDLSECVNFQGTAHRRDRCRMHGRQCRELETPHYTTGGRMLSFIISHDIHCIDHVFKSRVPPGIDRPLSYEFSNGISGIWFAFTVHKDARFSGDVTNRKSSKAIVKGALALHGADQEDAARQLTRMLKNEETFLSALQEVVNDHFGISGWTYS